MGNDIISEESRQVTTDNITISYILKRKNVKNLNLRIRPDATVIVSAPPVISADAVDSFIVRKKSYILKTLNEVKDRFDDKSQKQYISGEGYRLEGKNLRLKIIAADNNEIETDGVFLTLYIKDTDAIATKAKLVHQFYADTTNAVMNEVLDKFYEIFRKYDVQKPVLRFRAMRTRWGSCSAARRIITLNSRLIEAPRNCIEYVVMHELCHMIYPNHSRKFYTFLSMQMPDWRDRKKLLDEFFFA